MKDGIKLVALLTVFIALLAGAFFLIKKTGEIPENPSNATGNTAGNLYNEGLMCEDDGKVYFSNPYDEGALYSMNPDESEVTKLAKYYTKSINACGDYLYFYQAADGSSAIAGFGGRMMGIYRSRKNGQKIKCLDKTAAGTVALCGNDLIYQHYTNIGGEGMTLYKVGIDKQDYGQILADIADPSCVRDGGIYYAGSNGDHNLYYLDGSGGMPLTVYEGNIWNPIVLEDGNTVYYMNVRDDYRLHRLTINDGQDVQITQDRVDCFNMTGSHIYYQKNDKTEPALMRCDMDGGNSEVVANGQYTHINVTSRYVYYQMYGVDDVMYHTPADGIVDGSDFSAARKGVM